MFQKLKDYSNSYEGALVARSLIWGAAYLATKSVVLAIATRNS